MTPCSFTSIGTACAGTVILLKNVGDNCLEKRRYWVISFHENTHLENGAYGHSRFCNTDFDDKLACLNLSGV